MNKKIISIGISALVVIGGILGYKAVFSAKVINANGIVVIGKGKAIKAINDRYKNDIKSSDKYKIKTALVNKEKVLILSKSTAEAIVKQGILEEKDTDCIFGHPIDELPNIPKDEAILFTNNLNHKKIKEVTINNEKIKVSFDSRTWIGRYPDFRNQYDNFILVMEDAKFNKIKAEETNMELFKLNKSFGNLDYGVEKTESEKRAEIETAKIEKLYPEIQGFEFVTIKD